MKKVLMMIGAAALVLFLLSAKKSKSSETFQKDLMS